MSSRVEWLGADAYAEIVRPEGGWTDAYGQGIEPGMVGLALGGLGNSDFVMVEGTLADLRVFAERILDAVEGAE